MPTSSDNAPGGQERPPAVLRLTDVAAGYGGAAIVSGVSISVGPGEVVSIIGPNGAGKSTLLKAVTGRLPVMTGTVTFNDRNITNWRGHLLARMGLGFVPQTKDVFDTLTVTENLEMGGYLLSKPQLAARMDKVLSTFPALADMRSRTASKLSGGERKMLAVARVLMLSRPFSSSTSRPPTCRRNCPGRCCGTRSAAWPIRGRPCCWSSRRRSRRWGCPTGPTFWSRDGSRSRARPARFAADPTSARSFSANPPAAQSPPGPSAHVSISPRPT